MFTRRQMLLAACLQAGCARGDASLRAAAWLWKRQADDGGWHSETYGLLRSGQSLTGLALDSLLGSSHAAGSGSERAAAFLLRNTDAEGSVGRMDKAGFDYPTYATSLMILALARLGRSRPGTANYLRRQQFTSENGWSPAHPVYGAWGMGGRRLHPPYTGHVDLSMTRHALQALAAAGATSDDPAFKAARVFVGRCQNSDGGFFFSTVVEEANKAGSRDGRYRSYGSATADGLLCLLAIDDPKNSDRVRAAAKWIEKNHSGDRVPGFESHPDHRWAHGLAFYYAAAVNEAFRGLGREAPPHRVLGSQRRDGSYSNPESLVKEDDPLIATALALRALS
jgi:hypothetical protein